MTLLRIVPSAALYALLASVVGIGASVAVETATGLLEVV